MIKIVIPRADIERYKHSTYTAMPVMQSLKAKGAPVSGALFPVTISGCITIANDPFDDLAVIWHDCDGESTPEAGVVCTEIVVSRHDINRWNSSLCVGDHVMRALRKKGVPVHGVQFPTSVERGYITIEQDAFDDLVVAWRQ